MAGTRNARVTLLVLGDLHPDVVTDPQHGLSQNAQYVRTQRGLGNHICVVDNAGFTALLQGLPAPCLSLPGDPVLRKPVAVSSRSDAVDARKTAAKAETHERAVDLLRRLIGVDLQTASGQWNRILGVTDNQATVATDRSPEGTPVPISSVQDALDRMLETGQVVIRPDEVGYRSAFIGAVLRTLPGVTLEGSPPVARVDPANSMVLSQSAALTFEGDLENHQQGMGRGEQGCSSPRRRSPAWAIRRPCRNIAGDVGTVAFQRHGAR